MKKEEIKREYYYTDIEPTLDNLKDIINICEKFSKDGGDRLMCAMDLRSWDLDEIERLTCYIQETRQKMEKELARLKRYKESFNDMFATDHNNYYNSVHSLLKHIRSHTSPLKKLLRKTCSRTHPNKMKCERHNIQPKSVRKESVLASNSYQKPIFNINDPSTPIQAKGLYNELSNFFDAEKECMEICIEVLREEADIRKDPIKSKYVLDKYRRKAHEKLRGQIILITDDIIKSLKQINPAYLRLKAYATDEAFAQEEFHKHNVTDMDHFCLIELDSAKRKNELDSDEIAYWGDNPIVIRKIKYVVKNFDKILPDYFKHKMMGKFQFYFCKWALPNNISNATKYFLKHYNGNWKPSKYGAVNSHSREYDHHSKEVKEFNEAIEKLLNEANLPKKDIIIA